MSFLFVKVFTACFELFVIPSLNNASHFKGEDSHKFKNTGQFQAVGSGHFLV